MVKHSVVIVNAKQSAVHLPNLAWSYRKTILNVYKTDAVRDSELHFYTSLSPGKMKTR